MAEIIGIIGSVMFAICGIPPAFAAIKARSCNYSTPFLLMWAAGEGCMIVFALLTYQNMLLLNYVPNAICLGIMVYFNKGLK